MRRGLSLALCFGLLAGSCWAEEDCGLWWQCRDEASSKRVHQDYQESARLFAVARERLAAECLPGTEDARLATILEAETSLLEQIGDPDGAEQLQLRALAIRRKVPDQAPGNLRWSLVLYARGHMGTEGTPGSGKADDALAWGAFEEAMGLYQKVLDEDPSSGNPAAAARPGLRGELGGLATVHAGRAEILRRRKDFQGAESEMKEAIRLEDFDDPSQSTYSMAVNVFQLACIYRDARKQADAQRELQRAKGLFERSEQAKWKGSMVEFFLERIQRMEAELGIPAVSPLSEVEPPATAKQASPPKPKKTGWMW